MKKKDKNCRYLNLYHEDFDKYGIWKDVCDSLGISYSSKSVTIFYDKTKTEVI